jgi:hypothetical protein
LTWQNDDSDAVQWQDLVIQDDDTDEQMFSRLKQLPAAG